MQVLPSCFDRCGIVFPLPTHTDANIMAVLLRIALLLISQLSVPTFSSEGFEFSLWQIGGIPIVLHQAQSELFWFPKNLNSLNTCCIASRKKNSHRPLQIGFLLNCSRLASWWDTLIAAELFLASLAALGPWFPRAESLVFNYLGSSFMDNMVITYLIGLFAMFTFHGTRPQAIPT